MRQKSTVGHNIVPNLSIRHPSFIVRGPILSPSISYNEKAVSETVRPGETVKQPANLGGFSKPETSQGATHSTGRFENYFTLFVGISITTQTLVAPSFSPVKHNLAGSHTGPSVFVSAGARQFESGARAVLEPEVITDNFPISLSKLCLCAHPLTARPQRQLSRSDPANQKWRPYL
jgi:hypothetical protein